MESFEMCMLSLFSVYLEFLLMSLCIMSDNKLDSFFLFCQARPLIFCWYVFALWLTYVYNCEKWLIIIE